MTRTFALVLLAGCSPLVVDFGDKGDTGPDDIVVSGDLSVTPASADLGVVFLGTTGQAVFTVTNVGDGDVAVTVEVASAVAGAWTYTLTDPSPDPGASVDLVLTLTPSTWGDHAATVTVRDTAGSGAEIVLPIAALAQQDDDGDGVGSLASGGSDCDDGDAEVYPGAEETWYDGVDQDCAGDDDYDQDKDGVRVADDCDDTDAAVFPGAEETWYDGVDQDCAGDDDYDQDADGAQLGADCVDTDPTINPTAEETWYDGVDQDCAGDDDYDQDKDGVQLVDDCDDTDAASYPGAPETWYDGIDQDCAGDDDYDQDKDGVDYPADCDDTDATIGAPTAETWNGRDDDCDGTTDELSITTAASGALYGATSSLALGGRGTLSLGGDVDDDGADDIVAVSSAVSNGAGWLVSGATAASASGAIGNYDRASFTGSTYYAPAYVQGPLLDLTGDASADLLVGAVSTYVGSAVLLDGDAASGALTVTSTYTGAFSGDSTYDLVRWGVGGDLDGDGVPEVVTGAVLDNYGSFEYYTGNIAVFSSANFSGAYTLDDADDEIHGAEDYDYLGTAVAIGDVTGDGYGDVLAGASGNDEGASNGGAVYVFAGNAGLSWSDDRADGAAATAILGTTGSMALGGEALPTPADVDGDGTLDVALAASASGRAWLFTTLGSGEVPVTDADAIWSGTASSFATAVALGDLDDDGLAEVAIGASGDDTAASNAGAVFLFYGGGAFDTSMTSADAGASFWGATAGDALGSGLAAGGDADGDGSHDLLLGANGVDTGAAGGGAVYVVLGR